MPCVYCGLLIPRSSDRCPECRTSYSLAVRRASRDIEGPWFYLESRNPSNRGVDFGTMLKLVEKGRLKADSVVRGPTTHQDWMYAAETPLLSKHLGICCHCFASASPRDAYCATCRRSLDERPARLAPGVSVAGAPSRFADRDALEEQLVSAATTPATREPEARVSVSAEVGGVASSGSAGGGYLDSMSDSTVVTPATRRSRHRGEPARRVKPHVVALLTVATVVPLFVLITYLPLEYLLGDPSHGGSFAYNFRQNRLGLKRLYPWSSRAAPAEAAAPTEEALSRKASADRARAEGRYDEAVRLYAALAAEYGEGTEFGREVRTRQGEAERFLQQQGQELEGVLASLGEINRALDGADTATARSLMNRLTSRQIDVARAAGHDPAALLDRIAAAERAVEAQQRQSQVRAEVQQRLADSAARESEGNLQAALAILESLRNTYPAEFLPHGYDLEQRVTSLKDRIAQTARPRPQPTPPPETGKQKAGRLWAESEKLHDQGKYDDAIAKLEEIKKLPQGDWPQDLDKRIDYLKRLKWFGR